MSLADGSELATVAAGVKDADDVETEAAPTEEDVVLVKGK
jgi:hypothetical protein